MNCDGAQCRILIALIRRIGVTQRLDETMMSLHRSSHIFPRGYCQIAIKNAFSNGRKISYQNGRKCQPPLVCGLRLFRLAPPKENLRGACATGRATMEVDDYAVASPAA